MKRVRVFQNTTPAKQNACGARRIPHLPYELDEKQHIIPITEIANIHIGDEMTMKNTIIMMNKLRMMMI